MRTSDTLAAVGAVLATHRATQLLVEDEIARPLREAVTRRWPGSPAAYLVGCRACVSVWAGLAVGSGKLPRTVSYGLALSAASLLLSEQSERLGAVVSAYRRRS